jgi:predicted butyrate kinase (DUF1464 family)
MIAVGIDSGTLSYELFAIENEKPIFRVTFPTSEVKKRPELIFNAISDSKAEIIAGLSGYGLPPKKFSELSSEDVFLMTLNKGESTMGLRSLIELARGKNLNMYTIPAVIHLPTVPRWRKFNKIDMGTADKLCSVALALYQLSNEVPYNKQRFILVEAGFGFNAFIAVDGGKIVDGIGGTSGFPSFSSLSSIDGELVHLLSASKSIVFMGGVRSFLRDMGKKVEKIEEMPVEAAEWLSEFILKGIRAVEVSLEKKSILVLSGRLFDIPEFEKIFTEKSEKFDYDAIRLDGFGLAKQSAEGAAIIASGLAGGNFRDIVEHLEIMKARGTVLDYLTSDIRGHLSLF